MTEKDVLNNPDGIGKCKVKRALITQLNQKMLKLIEVLEQRDGVTLAAERANLDKAYWQLKDWTNLEVVEFYSRSMERMPKVDYAQRYSRVYPKVDPYKYATATDGILIKNKMPDGELYLTKKQWLEQGRKVRGGESPTILHPSRYNLRTCEYYVIEQTDELS